MVDEAKESDYYEFAGVRFLPADWVIEIIQTSRKISPSKTQRNFLLALVEKAGAVVTYDELRLKVWFHEPEMSSRLQHTMHVTKGQLVRLLEGGGVKANFIEPVPGKGYRLNAKVFSSQVEETDLATDPLDAEEVTPAQTVSQMTEQPPCPEPATVLRRLLGRHSIFIIVSSILYGLLFWVALFLETAYQFDIYAKSIMWLGLPIAGINAFAVATALALAQRWIQEGKSGGLLAGVGILVAAVIVSVYIASLCLPDSPVTLTYFQSQPAFAAFSKNAVIYFLPIGVFFLLIPFYFVVAVQLKAQQLINALPFDAIFLQPRSLSIICLAAIVYSLVSTFYLVDNLRTGTYHGLFVNLIFLRFVIYFGLGVTSLLWYKTVLNKALSVKMNA